MNKKIPILSLMLVIIIIFSTQSPVISANKHIESQEKIKIEINNYLPNKIEKNIKELSKEETNQLREILIEYSEAIKEKDYDKISYCENWLKNKNIIPSNYQNLYIQNIKKIKLLEILNNAFKDRIKTTNLNDNISNSMCYLHATGTGSILFPVEAKILEWMINESEQQNSSLAGLILFILLLVIFYIPVMLVTHLIPFRIALPKGKIILTNGKISTTGTEGHKSLEVTNSSNYLDMNISWFTGLTIGLPAISNEGVQVSDNFLFVSGFCFKAEKQN